MSQETSNANAPATGGGGGGGFWQGFETWKSPPAKDVAPIPKVGARAPSSLKLILPNGRPTLVVFLRHCAVHTFRSLVAMSNKYKDVRCVAISHSSAAATDEWLPKVGGSWTVNVIVDEARDLYAQWGLGISSTWHVANPMTLWSAVRLAKDEDIWNSNTASGSRWQMGGAFAVDRDGTVRWEHVARTADDIPHLEAAIESLGVEPSPKH